MTKYTDASRANQSGENSEIRLEKYLKEQNFSYKRALPFKPEIDFIIETSKGKIFADCTNQMIGGSVEEKLPHKCRKYWRLYNFDKIFIIRGDHKIHKEIIQTLNEDEKSHGYETIILTFDKFINYIEGNKNKGALEEFME